MQWRLRAALLVMALLVAVACDRSGKDWREAEAENTVAAYQRFTARHPDSEYAKEAEARIEALKREAAVESALRIGTADALEDALKRYPRDPSAPRLREALEKRYFDEAAASGTVTAWEEYLAQHADSQHASRARDRLNALLAERLPAFRAARTVRIDLSEDYGEADGVKLPFLREAEPMLPFAGLRIVKGDADVVLEIRSSGEPYGGNYTTGYLYTGVYLSGTISFRSGSERVSQSFEHEIGVPFMYSSYGSGPTTPESAPFDTAFNETVPLSMRRLIGRVFGPAPLLSALATGGNSEATAKAIGMMKPPPVANLIAMLRVDTRPGVRASAATALGEARAPEATRPLIDAVRVDGTIQSTAAHALARIGEPAVPELVTALSDPSRAVFLCAVAALGDIRDSSAIEPLTARLKDPRGRCEVVTALAKIPHPSALTAVVSMLADADGTVRACSARALEVQEFEEEEEEPQRDIRDLLEGNRNPEIFEGLMSGLEQTGSEASRSQIVSALSALGPGAIPRLVEELKHAHPKRREGAALALGKFWDEPRVIPALVTALRDGLKSSDTALAAAAAEGLGTLGDDRAVDPLIKALESSDARVRSKAIAALGQIGDPRAIPPLKALRTRKIQVSEVESALAMLEGPDE